MAEKLRSDYMSEVAARNASGLQKIKALQRRFQVRKLEFALLTKTKDGALQTDDLLFLHTRMDRRIYRSVSLISMWLPFASSSVQGPVTE